jgi:hypothetical protein
MVIGMQALIGMDLEHALINIARVQRWNFNIHNYLSESWASVQAPLIGTCIA